MGSTLRCDVATGEVADAGLRVNDLPQRLGAGRTAPSADTEAARVDQIPRCTSLITPTSLALQVQAERPRFYASKRCYEFLRQPFLPSGYFRLRLAF